MKNKYVLITGASSGIGEEFASQLAKENRDLILVARSKEKLSVIADDLSKKHKINIHVVDLDLSKPDAPEALFQTCQKNDWSIDLLINDAGIGQIGPFLKQDLKETEEMLNLNVLALTKLCYLFLPQIEKNKGVLLNVASNASFQPTPFLASYGATKAYVLNFTEAIRVENKDKDVLITALCPGPTSTHFFKRAHSSKGVIRFKFREPKEVVECALRGIKKKKPIILVGFENKLMVFLNRFFPRKMLPHVSQNMVKKQ